MGRKSRRKREARQQHDVWLAQEQAALPQRRLRGHVQVAGWGLIVSALLFWIGTESYRLQAETDRWPSTTARVLQTTIDVEQTRYRGRTSTFYIPIISYRYEVSGQTLEATTYRLRPRSASSEQDAQAIVEQFKRDTTITIRYNPHNPAQAFIAPPVPLFQDYVLIAGGIGAIGFSLIQISQFAFLRSFYQSQGVDTHILRRRTT
jgi:hypothetical protein